MKLSKSFQSFCKVVLILPSILLIYPLDYTFKIKRILLRCSIMILLACTFVGLGALIKDLDSERFGKSHTEKTFKFMINLITFLVSEISYFCFLFNRKNIENIYCEVARIEYIFFSEKIKIKYSYKRTIIIDSIVCLFSALFIFFNIRNKNEVELSNFPAVIIIEFVPAILTYMIGKTFVLFLYIIRQYFELIVKELLFNRKEISSSKIRKIEHLIVIHSRIYNFSKKVNNVYSNYLLGLSLVIFIMNLIVIISLMGLLFYNERNIDTFLYTCFYAFIWLTQFIDIVIICEKAAKIVSIPFCVNFI